jgi:hypothetical protein
MTFEKIAKTIDQIQNLEKKIPSLYGYQVTII